MAYKVVKKQRFVNQLYKLLLYLETNWGIAVAIDFQKNIDKHLELLETQPYIGKLTSKVNARSILITSHNRVVYKISGNKIIVIAMYDTRINPKKNKYL